MIRTAREEAAAILRRAREEADQVRALACREGFRDGHTRGLEEWTAERQTVRELLHGVTAAYRCFCEAQVPELAGLAVQAAEALLREQLALEPGRVVTVVREALEHVLASTCVSVHLNPVDLPIVRGNPEAVDPRARQEIRWEPDPSVERGGCWIESSMGEVDATVEGRSARLREAVLGND